MNSKDADLSGFDCARRLLEAGSVHLTMQEKMDMFFADDIVPLMVQENYVNHRPAIACE